eukprot:CAMPEP_0115082356 /NCGR_PEP_ID=MMETSP0227-20121206/19856_1 /TAXON_ID=89957 /ORGANISM="Polarella glacialis, Strain CCMP 1383" /LENGTH=154 /DNA_ID=CAMNT_0002470437 /DNA_START=54 /DNA_END=519 /DNA_ORIENTATION=+
MTLKPVRTLLLALALAHSAVLAATVDVDCVAEPEQEACCEMELDMPCFIKNMIRATDGCSVACKKKYQNLGWTCYNDSNMHWRWAFMQTNCDPLKVVEFTQPSTTLNAGYVDQQSLEPLALAAFVGSHCSSSSRSSRSSRALCTWGGEDAEALR